MTISDSPRVLIAGGGVAGLECALALQSLAADRVAVELIAPDRHVVLRALSVTEPFGPEGARHAPLAVIAADRGLPLHRDAIARVDLERSVVETQGEAELPFDHLVLALGARPAPAVRGALTFRGSPDAQRFRTVVDALRRQATRSLALVVPAGASWTLPLYELALQTARAAPRARLHVVTPEPAPLAAFGSAAAEELGRLLAEHDIEVHLARSAEEFADGRLWATSSWSLPVDQAIALPRLFGPHLRGIPSDPLGFVPVDDFMRVLGAPGVFAVGDVAALAAKQGGLAAQQADVAAQVIAATAGAEVVPQPYRPVLRGMLLTGGEIRYLRHDASGRSDVSDEALWWPPHKVAGGHLAQYLAAHPDLLAAAARAGR